VGPKWLRKLSEEKGLSFFRRLESYDHGWKLRARKDRRQFWDPLFSRLRGNCGSRHRPLRKVTWITTSSCSFTFYLLCIPLDYPGTYAMLLPWYELGVLNKRTPQRGGSNKKLILPGYLEKLCRRMKEAVCVHVSSWQNSFLPPWIPKCTRYLKWVCS